MAEAGILVSILEFEPWALLMRKRRPPEFVKKPTYISDSEDDESTAGKMPPTEESEPGE